MGEKREGWVVVVVYAGREYPTFTVHGVPNAQAAMSYVLTKMGFCLFDGCKVKAVRVSVIA